MILPLACIGAIAIERNFSSRKLRIGQFFCPVQVIVQDNIILLDDPARHALTQGFASVSSQSRVSNPAAPAAQLRPPLHQSG